SAFAVAACSSTVNGEGSSGSSGSGGMPGSSGTSGTPGTSGGTSGSPGSSGTSGAPGSSGALPPASSADAPVDVSGTCSPFMACGGDPQGTYDYTAGCVADVFAAAKAQCPALDTSNTKVTVRGSIYFN